MADVRVHEVHVFPDEADRDAVGRVHDPAEEVLPFDQPAVDRIQFHLTEEVVGQPLLLENDWNLVDRLRGRRANHGFQRHVAEQRDLLPGGCIERSFASRHYDVRLNPERPQLFDRVLRRFRLLLAYGAHHRNKSRMHEDAVLVADLRVQLAHCFHIRHRLDVADRAPELDYADIRA